MCVGVFLHAVMLYMEQCSVCAIDIHCTESVYMMPCKLMETFFSAVVHTFVLVYIST